MRWSGALPVVLAVAVATSGSASTGCVVKKSTHARTVDELAAARRKLAEQDRKLERLDRDLRAARSGKSSTEDELDRVRDEKEATEADLAELRAKREADQKRLAAYKDLQDRFKGLVETGALEVAFRNGQMTLKLPSGVLFPSGSADLSPAGQQTLARVTKVLKGLEDRRFLVAGHTDNVPIKTEQFDNNWFLSSARAVSVVQFMIAEGFPAGQLAAAGYADKDPVGNNKSKKGRQKNRRIEIILVPDLSDLPKLAREPR